jgi:polar amino acid transport system permease protein
MTCYETFLAYALRSIGIGEKLLPKSDFTLCQQFTLIGSGLIWNIYFAVFAVTVGFFLSNALALARIAHSPFIRKPAEWFVFVFRGSPLFIQFFLAYELLVLLPRGGMNLFGLTLETSWLSKAWAGALIVLFLNTAAYSCEIFYGALQSIPKGDLEAAEAYGMSGWKKFIRIQWPTMLRLAWPSYTNEAIFMLQSTTLVFFSGFPAFGQMGDALYYANYFADKTFNPFIPYPIVAMYFVLLTLVVIWLFGRVNALLNRYLPQNTRSRIRLRPQLIR